MADRGYRGRPQRGERADRQINAGHSRGLDAAWGCNLNCVKACS